MANIASDCFIGIHINLKPLPSICSFPLPTLAYISKTSKPAQVTKSHSTLYVKTKHILTSVSLEGHLMEPTNKSVDISLPST